MAGMLINNLLYFNDIYCLSYILDYLIGNSIITTFLLIVCSYIFNFCTWHRLIIIANFINITIAAAVAGLQKDVDGVKCKLPDTATIPYSPVVGVPSCVAAQYGLGLGLGFGFPGAWG